jgi:cytochrome bd-type quinol oxidase subunit 2
MFKKKTTYYIASIVFLIFAMSLPWTLFAACDSGYTEVNGVCMPGSTGLAQSDIKTILENILTWMLSVIGIVALIGFVVSGSIYILSSGDDKVAEKAKIAMKNSIIGMIVALGSFVIIQAIDSMLSGSSTSF